MPAEGVVPAGLVSSYCVDAEGSWEGSLAGSVWDTGSEVENSGPSSLKTESSESIFGSVWDTEVSKAGSDWHSTIGSAFLHPGKISITMTSKLAISFFIMHYEYQNSGGGLSALLSFRPRVCRLGFPSAGFSFSVWVGET